MKVDFNGIELRAMIAHLESLGYKVTPARNEALTYHRATDKSHFNAEAFQWEAVHMIARQLHPGHLRFESKDQPLNRVITTAKLYL